MKGFYTQKGLALAAKVAAGATLRITKVTAGSGTTAETAAALAAHRQTLDMGIASASGSTAVLPATLTEAKVRSGYTLTELGVWARDPDAGEILYQVFRLPAPQTIVPAGPNVYRFYLNHRISSAEHGSIKIACTPSGLLTEADVETMRGMVMKTEIQQKELTVEAAALAETVRALPRMLTDKLILHVNEGVCADTLQIAGFYGPGSLLIQRAWGLGPNTVLLEGGCDISSAAYVYLEGLAFRGRPGTYKAYTIEAVRSPRVNLSFCTIDNTSDNTDLKYGLHIGELTHAYLNNCTVKNAREGAAYFSNGACAAIWKCVSENCPLGIETYRAGVLTMGPETDGRLGAEKNKLRGGAVVTAGGELLKTDL